VQRGNWRGWGWQGASLVAITYVYFLIFAQFAFLKRLAGLGLAGEYLNPIMAAMAFGGIAISLLAPRLAFLPSANTRLRVSLATSSAAAFFTLLPLTFASAVFVSFLIGAGLGLLTVTLVTHLRKFAGSRNPLLAVGVGTGIGYLLCNLPGFFNASPQAQSIAAALLCVLGIGVTFAPAPLSAPSQTPAPRVAVPFLVTLVGFTALVWLDSAAFFIIQNTPQLKAGTWQGTLHLWTNGALHIAAALLSVWLLSRKGLATVLGAALVALGTACLLLRNPDHIFLASVFYPIGVSLYSFALVAYPALLATAENDRDRGKIAGWLYAVAGWISSAMGIGMGQHLGHVPIAFVAAAGAAVLLPHAFKILRTHHREVVLATLVLLAAFLLDRLASPVSGAPTTSVERGRALYISEGCIHCHSQYVRPNSNDVLMWGPVTSISELRKQEPPLIGNRRQGPDLSQVGARRSAAWLKAHFFNPSEVSGASIMPSYGFLFRDERGDDLVAYLESLHTDESGHQQALEELWQPSADAVAHANAAEGEQLYWRDCATCHDANGDTWRTWQDEFKHRPPNLFGDPLSHLSPSETPEQRFRELSRITKFGIVGTDMPGHEYLSDRNVASLSLWLQQHILQSNRNP
jgi:cbb3-type cytochrome c oxidase subunit II